MAVVTLQINSFCASFIESNNFFPTSNFRRASPAMFLSVFGALVIMMSRLKVSFFRYRSEHAAEKLQLRALTRQCT